MEKPKFPEEWIKLKNHFLDYHKNTLKHKTHTLEHYATNINCLYRFMLENKISELTNLTQADIVKFQYYIYRKYHISTFRSIEYNLLILRAFCRYLYHNDLIWKNPLSGIKYIQPHEYGNFNIKRYYNLNELITRWTNWMKKREYHIQNVKEKLDSLNLFISFMEQRGIKTIYKVEPGTLDEYKKFLQGYQYQPGCYYNPPMQTRILHHICQFFTYLHREGLIRQDVTQYMNLKEYSRELSEKYRKTQSFNPMAHRPIQIDSPEIKELLEKFVQYKISIGGSSKTSHLYIVSLEKFYSYMQTKNYTDLRKITKRDIMDYQTWLYEQKTLKGNKYAPNTLLSFFIGLRAFFDYLAKYDYIVCDPASAIDTPKEEHGIPHTCMTEREVNILLEKPDITTPIGLRDRAIMETLYSTGIRANELINTRINDIDFTEGLLRVEEPKGGKSYQRIIPIGKTAREYIKMYLSKVRPLYSLNSDKGYIFLSRTGGKLVRGYLSCMIRKYLFHLGLRKKITAHSFRVSCATHMLLHKADIRYVQQQLGHISIRTTQGYTRLVPKDLKAVHQRCHPREKRFEEITAWQE